jgi:hypothetical protein
MPTVMLMACAQPDCSSRQPSAPCGD